MRGSKRRTVKRVEQSLLSDFQGQAITGKGNLRQLFRPARGARAISDAPDEVARARRSLRRRWQRSERKLRDWLNEHNGPDTNTGWSRVRGHIGPVSQFQFDQVSRTYAAEGKNVKMPVTLIRWWQQVCQVADDWSKAPMIRWEPTPEDARKYPVKGRPLPIMHCIAEDRHAELLDKERWYDEHYTS